MAITIIHDWYEKADTNIIYSQLYTAFDLYKRYLADIGYIEKHPTRIIFHKKKYTERLTVVIKNLPEPEALISAINFCNIIICDDDPLYVVDGKIAILNNDGEVEGFKKWIKNKKESKR